jgi:hypothetical protein
VVLLDNQNPSEDVVDMLHEPLLEHRVHFVRGTLMNDEDLMRAGADSAVACFIFANGWAPITSTNH